MKLKRWDIFRFIILICFIAVISGCGSGGGGSDSSSKSSGSSLAGSVSLSSGTSNLTADGSSQTTITATVKDTGGNNVPNGTTVNFTTTAGTLSAASAATSSGLATVTLTSASNVGSTTVTGTSGGVSGTTTVNFVPGAVNTISLTATPNNLTADGVSTSVIRAVVQDANNNAVADGETITFSMTAGTGSLSSLTGTTTGGIVTVTYTASNTAGTETVTADSTNGKTKSVNITLIAEQVGEVDISTDDGSLVADGMNSTTVKANVKNINGSSIADGTTVSFSTTKGTLSDPGADTLGGLATVVLTSPVTVGTAIIKATAGSITQIATVQFVPGITATLTMTADPLVIDADGSSISLISASAVDANNNPVADNTTVTFSATAGTLSNSSVATSNGVAQVSLTSSTNNETAVVTAVSDLVPQTVNVTFGSGPGSGEPSYIIVTANPDKIKVKGTGGVESSTITASVKDENGQPYNDSAENIRFEILSGPEGGVVLDSGDGSPSSAETATTQGGIASMSLKSGTVSGSVRIKVSVLKDGSGVALVTPLTAISTNIGIEAGDPFNMTVYPSTGVTDNGDGSLSRIFSTMIQDQYGNPVADNTAVYFGIIDNPPNGYKSSGADGITNSTNTFASATTNFISDGIIQFDTLIIREGQDEGGHIIDTPANGSVTLVYNLKGNEAGLDFVAGNAELGVICGVVPTGNLEPDSTCTPKDGKAIKGVAHTRLTWPGKAIFKPFNLYAESEGRNLGQSYSGSYNAAAPVTITVDIAPFDTVLAGTTGIVVNAHFKDGASNNIQNESLTFTTSNTAVSGFGLVGTATEKATTGTDGVASVSDMVTKSCLDAQSTVTISVLHGTYSGTATLTIELTKPTADFTSADQGDSDNVIFLDNSATIAGSSITAWSWDFDGDGTEDSNVQNPGKVSMGLPGSYLSTLTVTNSLGCTDTIIKTVTVP